MLKNRLCVPRRSRYHKGNVFREQLKRAATLTEEDFVQLGKCRRPHNWLGFACQVAFVRLFDRFPQQQPKLYCKSPPLGFSLAFPKRRASCCAWERSWSRRRK